MSRHGWWRVCYLGVVVLSILTFTPLVLPLGTYEPMVFGMPYTLWTGILDAIALVGLTYMATQVYPPNDESLET